MLIFPAIDLKNGQCVRLRKGEFDSIHRVSEDPVKTAEAFRQAGADCLHVVDLDGAREGIRRNRELILEITRAFGGYVEIGGGIRDMAAVEDYLSGGLSRVILGSAALKNPAFLKEAAARYGDRLAVGIDAKNGLVSVSGWEETSDVGYIEFAKICEDNGIQNIIFTDIGRDGMLSGPNLVQLKALDDAVGCDITASGGIKDIGDIAACKALGLYGAICGKSIYSGTLDLREALELCRE